MAKQGIDGKIIKSLLYDVSGGAGWALCVGAGISLPIFPSWKNLVKSLLLEDVPEPEGTQLASKLLSTYSADALIQAARDRLGLTEDLFSLRLAELLYRPLRHRLKTPEWRVVVQAFCARDLGSFAPKIWQQFQEIREKHFCCTTASSLAQHIAAVLGTPIAPTAILSFNAEPLFFTLINATVATSHIEPGQMESRKGQLTRPLDLVTHSISDRRPGKVPYIYCHGLLPVPDATSKRKPFESVDKLVFSESDYLQLSNNSFAWQSTSFLEICSSRRVVFVGVSLSDPNMRRWLSWVHTNRTFELLNQRSYSGPSTPHLWIQVRPRPRSPSEEGWIESSVAHLGVRLVWINEWSDVGAVMLRLFGLHDRRLQTTAVPLSRGRSRGK